MENTTVVSREEWLAARLELLEKEKEVTRLRDELNAARRELPAVKVETEYVFDGPNGDTRLIDLFAGRSQLIVYHFMFDPAWDEGCTSCSFFVDHLAPLGHLHQRDTTLVAVSRAPYAKIQAFKARMGWDFPWLSSYGTSFNYDFGVTMDDGVTPISYNYQDLATLQAKGFVWHMAGEQHGISVFTRDGDTVLHTYSTYGRGPEMPLGTYHLLDLTPLGRQEEGTGIGRFLHHDKYPVTPDYPAAATAPRMLTLVGEAHSHEGSGCNCHS